MKRLNLVLSMALVLGMVLAVSCGGAAPAPTVTVTKTASAATVTVTVGATPGAAPTVTVTQTAPAVPAVTVTVTPTPPKLVKVREGKPAGGTGYFFTQVGVQQGFYAKRGIEHQVLEMTTSAARMAPFVGQADISAGDILAFYPERKDVRTFGRTQNAHYSLMVRKDSPYQSYQDLKGKKVGTLGPATGLYQMLKVLTKLEGLDLEKDFAITHGEAAVQVGWLLKGEVEAIHVNEPFPSKLLVSDGDKVRELYWLDDLYRKHTGSTWQVGSAYTTDAWAKANPEVTRALGQAWDDILLYAWGHPALFKSDLARKAWGVDDPRVLELLEQSLPRIVAGPPYGPAYAAGIVKKVQLMADAGIIPKEAVDWFKGTILFAD